MQAEVKGTTMPILEVSLDQGEEVVSSHGELAWMTQNVQLRTDAGGGGGGGGFMQGLKRAVGGGGIFITHYQGPGMIVFAAKVPGHIMPVDIAPGQAFLVHRHGWLCGSPGIVPTVGLQQSFRGGMWGGDGFVLQRLEGQGTAWIELSGELTTYDLPPGQTLMVHPGHIGMFEGSVQFTMTRIPGIANALFGGDGFHLVALTGPGRVWLQSMPLPVLAHALAPYLQQQDHAGAVQSAGGGMAVGGILGDMLGGGRQGGF
jgi:uncharacterized protein (AIM24 family)